MKLLIIIFTLLISTSKTFGQNASANTLERWADSLFASHRYEEALLEYQRIIFIGEVGPSSIDVIYKIASASRAAGYYQPAIQHFELLENLNIHPNQVIDAQLAKASILLENQNWNSALAQLYEIDTALAQHMQLNRFFLYNSIALYRLEKYVEAQNAMNLLLSINQQNTQVTFDTKELNKPKPSTAYILSAFFPGSGQFYAGDARQGFNSLSLATVLILGSARILTRYSILDAFLTIIPWLQRYYIGGMIKSKKIAERERMIKRDRILQETINQIELLGVTFNTFTLPSSYLQANQPNP